MVIIVHSCEFFFIGENGINIRTLNDGFWVSIIDSMFRASVPLFVMASSYLLLPLKGDTVVFYKKRFVRVLIPFVIWSLLYAILPYTWNEISLSVMKSNLIHLLYNFNNASGHLWFVYMLIGLYLFMPVLSPWLKEVPRKLEKWFLIVWFLTTFSHYIKLFVPDILGECYWNEFGTFWYFSGFIGYLVLAHYVRIYIDWSLKKSLIVGLTLFLIGYAFTSTVYYHQVQVATELQQLELSWRFNSFNVVLMTIGLFLIIKKINFQSPTLYKLVQDISKLSYGMYLAHIFILNFAYRIFGGYFSTPITIFLIGTVTYVVSYIVIKALSFLPKSKYIVG